MAYVDRFIFRFSSVSGKAVRITIADNDYTGAAVERRLGGSPQLRCELSGNIHGMSLEIPAECKVDDEFAVLYTSDPTRFAVRLEVDNVVVWRGFVTPELYAAPWVDPPYDVQITATDGLGELKMMEWPAIGSRTLKEILDTVLGATGLALGIRMISAAANDIAAAEDLLTGTTVNLDHMAGKSYYDVLDGLLGSLHCTISQRNGVWLLVRETDVTSLTSGGQVSDTSGNTYPVKSFGSSQTHDCWPVGRLTTEIVPAKSVVEVECPNHLASLIADPDMELNLWQTNGSWTGEDGGYYTLDLNEYISQVITVANASRDADPGFRIKVSSRHTTPFGVGIMRLTVMATGRDPRSGSDKTLYLKEVTTQGRTQMEWVTEESHFDDGLGLPRTLDHQDCKEFETDIFRLPTSFNPLKSITVKVTAGKSTVCVHSVHIECMSVYDKAVTRLVMDNGARGDESNSPLFADSFVGNKGNFLLTNSLRGVAGAIVRTWSSDAIPSVPYGEWLSKDMALSVATPRLRMSGRLFTVTSLPALFYSNKGLSYITEEWSLDLIEDEADISLISLPAAALQTVEVSVIVEDNNGRKGTVSGGEIVSPKTGDSSSGSGYLDWFIAESYEEDGETKYRLKLNPKYQGMYAEGWVSAGGVSDQGGGGGGTGYLRDLLDVNASMSPTQGQALVWDDALGKWTAGDVSVDLTPFERIANRVTTVSSSSNHTQYPTAKAVYDIVNTMLSSAMRFQGVTSTALVDGSTTNPVVVDGASYTATRGDVVVRSDVGLEYLWTGARWQQLGDETSYAKKTVTITGSGYLTGGGNLEASSEIDVADAVKAKIDNGATAFGYFTDGAANEAIKLKTARKIWGQNFDGTKDVDGTFSFFGNGGDATLKIYSASGVFPQYGDEAIVLQSAIDGNDPETSSLPAQIPARSVICLQPRGGFIGMGTTSPLYKVDIVGDSRTSGKVYIGTSGGFLEVVNVGTTASPVYALKSSLPFYSDSWVSAGGVSSTGSGGGITGYLKDLLDVNGSMIPVDGQALVWDSSLGDNGRWTSKNVSVDLTPFERTTNKVTSISASSTDGQYPSARAVYIAMGNYLPLTGGTITGTTTLTYGTNLEFVDSNGENHSLRPLATWPDSLAHYVPGNSWVRIWDSGNDGSGSGLDADLLDGKHADSFATIASPNNLMHSGNEFTFIPPNYNNNIWFNYRTTDYSLSGNVTGYYFGDGKGNALAYITDGQFSGNAASATKLQTARKLWGQNFDGRADVSGILTGVNSDNTTGIGTAIAIGCPSVDGLSAAGNGVGITMGISGESYYAKIATVFEDSSPRYLQPALAFYTMYNSYQAGSEVERMRISANGYVGIGTTSPERGLDVVGSLQAGNGTYEAVLETNSDGGRLTFWSNSSLWHKGYIDGSTVVINTITGGNVGIGTSTPAYKLDINGIIRADKLIGTATGITETSRNDEEFTYQATPVHDIADGYRIDRIKGNTRSFNQLVPAPNTWSVNYGTIAVSGSEIVYTVTSVIGSYFQSTGTYGTINLVSGHKYLVSCKIQIQYDGTVYLGGDGFINSGGAKGFTGGVWESYKKIATASTSSVNANLYFSLYGYSEGRSVSVGDTMKIKDVMLFDLTLMFGAGNEPSTVAEFEAMFPEAYYDYNPGELINNSAEGIETVGFNLWDEKWELGYIDDTSGRDVYLDTTIRGIGYIPVNESTNYYFAKKREVNTDLYFYDVDKNYLGSTIGHRILYNAEKEFTTPAGTKYMRFYMSPDYGPTYLNDICINLSDPDRNGEYEPYWSAKTALGLSSIKVKDSNGDILEINGLASAGDVRDEIRGGKYIKRVGRVDLGTLDWGMQEQGGFNRFNAANISPEPKNGTYWNFSAEINSKGYDNNGAPITANNENMSIGYYSQTRGIYIRDDAYSTVEAFAAAMSGVYLYYELATPVTYELVSPVPLSGRIDGNGTMRVISDGPVAPFRGDITYGCNPGQMGADASSVKSYLDTMLEIKVVDGVPMLHTALPFYSDSFVSAGGLSGTGGSGSGSSLRDLSDVQLPEIITTGSALVYNGEKWVQSDAAFVPQTRTVNGLELSSNISLSLGDLSNVNTAGASNGQSLIYNGSEWIAGTPAGAKFFHGTCSTSSSSNTKVVDCPSFTSADLVAGTAIAIVMYNRCDTTSAVTINVNGTGANTLLAGFANRKAWSAGELILAVYDGSGEWDMLPTWYYTYYYGGGGSGGGGGTGSTVVVTPRLSSGTRIATITVDGSGTDLYAPSVSVTQTQGSTGGTRIASVNSTAIYAPAVTVTQVQTSGVEVARIKVGSANPVSIFAPSGSSGSSGVQTVVGKTGDVTTAQIADALTNAGYKLTDTVVDTSSFLPLSAGSGKALTGDLYTRAILPTASNTYDLGSSSKYFKNNYMKRIYLADGVYIEYDSTNRCVYVHGAGIATDSFVSAGGVSNT